MKNLLVYTLLSVSAFYTQTAHATFVDSDSYCRIYGCVVISDGFGSNLYDVYRFSGGGTVPVGSPLIPWSGNPFHGAGPVNIVETGSTTPIPTSTPSASNGTQLAIDSDGNSTADISINDNNGNGYLDVSDSLSEFTLTNASNVMFSGGGETHSFYLTSRSTKLDLRARATVTSASADFGSAVSLSGIPFGVSITLSGNDSGVAYGSKASNGNFSATAGINDLGDVSSTYTSVARFTRAAGIRRFSDGNQHVYRQSLRFNLIYGYPIFDLSQGDGAIQFRVEYAPYKL